LPAQLSEAPANDEIDSAPLQVVLARLMVVLACTVKGNAAISEMNAVSLNIFKFPEDVILSFFKVYRSVWLAK
jgi:replication-associated recombination protein RarA